jgi:hypothetical protein
MAAELPHRHAARAECSERSSELCSQLLILAFNPCAQIFLAFGIQKGAILIDHPNSAGILEMLFSRGLKRKRK